MLYSWLVGLVLMTAGSGDDRPGGAERPSDGAAYQAAAAKTGPDADAQVRLALWCEAHGLNAERMKHLAAAVARDPSNALARGLLGLVSHDGKWESPEEVAHRARDDPRQRALLDDYLRRRARIADRADDHWKLATWCEQNGLKTQAIAHYHAVRRLDPRREAAWRRLGFKKVGNHWVKPEWQAATKREAEEQTRADRHWKPLLEQYRIGLSSRIKERRADAETALAAITDPRAVRMVLAVFVPRGASGQRTAVEVLGQIDAPGSSRALTLLALSSRSPEVRGQAVQALRLRDPRDFAPMLVAMIRDPIKYDVKNVQGPGNPGELVIRDGTTNRKRLYSPPPAPQFAMGPTDYVSLDADGLPVINRYLGQYDVVDSLGGMYTPQQALAKLGSNGPSPAQIAGTLEKAGLTPAASQKLGATLGANSAWSVASSPVGGQVDMASFLVNRTLEVPIGEMMLQAQMAAQAAEAQLVGDVRALAAYNDAVRGGNRRAQEILSGAVGLDLGDDRAAWSKWLVDLFGYAYHAQQSSAEETTIVEQVPPIYVPQTITPIVTQSFTGGVTLWHSCFAAGTLVRAIDGLRPIESLRAGDVVLTQDPRNGGLKYEAVVVVYHNPPNSTYRIGLAGGESIVATGIHRLWKAGKGWTMTRELKPGDTLRTLGGLARVESVDAEKKQPVYNLQVADGESYFVGNTGVLAHDNSTINPVAEPFDAVATPAAGPGSASPQPRRQSMLGR